MLEDGRDSLGIQRFYAKKNWAYLILAHARLDFAKLKVRVSQLRQPDLVVPSAFFASRNYFEKSNE